GESGTGPSGRLADAFVTLAERLEDHGYRTFGVVANHGYLSSFFRLNQGFQYWDPRPATEWSSAKYYLRFGLSRRILAGHPGAPHEGHRAFRSADEITREGLALLDHIGDREAFFFINYMDAHYPYLPPQPFADLVPGRDPAMDPAVLERKRRDVMLRGAQLTEAERAHLISQYDGGIAYVDSRFGQFLDELKRRGLYDDALIIVTSDHGEAFGERGFIDHGVSVYEDQVNVPLLIKYPAQEEAAVVSATVSSVDVVPTVLDVLEIESKAAFPGLSLRGDLSGRPDPVVAEHYPFEVLVKNDPRHGDVERALYDGGHKLIRRDGREELYDLNADGAERTDRGALDPERAAGMSGALNDWLGR
ncbi:MAG: sulfatase-like hydrolase/transferase, partial [Gemmatimonadetes bacterium]|nr:sulfatase-like hydrolase/transferase [Gemmatimonadota bacterium]